MLVIICAISVGLIDVKAWNYTPSVAVGDELVYESESFREGYTEFGTIDRGYTKYLIASIQDEMNYTFIVANISSSEDNKNYTLEIDGYTVGILGNYSEAPVFLLQGILLIPGTRIFDYVGELYEYFEGECNLTSLDSGYGIKIEYVDPHLGAYMAERTFNNEGISEKTKFRYENLFGDEGEYYGNSKLYSINGKRYSIPGYPWYLVLIFSMVGLVGIFIYTKRKKSLFIV